MCVYLSPSDVVLIVVSKCIGKISQIGEGQGDPRIQVERTDKFNKEFTRSS